MTPYRYFDTCLMIVGMLMKLLIPVVMIGLSSSSSLSSSSNVVAQQAFTGMHYNTDTMNNNNGRLSNNNDNRNNQRFLQNREVEEDYWSNYYTGSVHVNYGPNGHPFDQLNNIDSSDSSSNNFTLNQEALNEQQQSIPNNNEHNNIHRQEQSSFTYQPIRINFATDPIDQRRGRSTNMDQQIDDILNNVLTTATDIWTSHLSVIPTVGFVQINSSDCQGKFSDTLQYQTFNDTDLVLIVDGLYTLTCSGGALAYASVCATDQFGRPLIGFMNFCLLDNTTYTSGESTAVENQGDNYNNNSGSTLLLDIIQSQYSQWTNKTFRMSDIDLSILEVAIHEMAHALGVFSPLFPYFRNKDNGGMPYTSLNGDMSVPVIGKLCINGTYAYGEFPSDDVIYTEASTTHDGIYYQYLVTPRVVQVARNFFNCPTMIGARLSYDYGSCIGSHWHERMLYTELLSPIVSSIGENVLSPFTLALLDDSGWYQVDYRNSELPAYGIAGGCDFVDNDCIVDQQIPDYINGEFCNQLLEIDVTRGLLSEDSLDSVFCEPSYHSWAVCDLFQFSASITSATDPDVPIYYFNDTNIRSQFSDADSCPIPSVPLGLDCTKNQPYNPFYPGEKVGTGSRCFNAFYNGTSTKNVYQPSCNEVICDDISKNVIINVGTLNLTCEYSQQEILIPGTSNGYIICPRLQALCPKIFSCPYACSGRGTCIYPQNDGDDTIPYCQCFDTSNTDPGCSLAEVVAARPLTTPSPISSAAVVVPTPSPMTSNDGGSDGSLQTYEPTSRRIVDSIPLSQPTEFDYITESPNGITKPTTPTTKTDEQVGFRAPTGSPVVVSSANKPSIVNVAVSLWMIGAIVLM